MAENVNPGSALGDFVEEFKKAPTAGKIAIVGVVVVVIGIALYMRKKASASAATPATGTTPASSGSITGSSGGTGATMPTPVAPGNPAQPTPVQGGGQPPRGVPITQKTPAKVPAVGNKPAPKMPVARNPQSTYKQTARPAAPTLVYKLPPSHTPRGQVPVGVTLPSKQYIYRNTPTKAVDSGAPIVYRNMRIN